MAGVSVKAEDLFRGWHGREVEQAWTGPKLPAKLACFGRLHRIDYLSDKRDPGSPFGEGKQGVWKRFTHAATARPRLYDAATTRESSDHLRVEWPKELLWLGWVIEVEYKPGDWPSGLALERFSKGTGLWGFPDGTTALILPPRSSRAILIRGKGFTVEPRGLVG